MTIMDIDKDILECERDLDPEIIAEIERRKAEVRAEKVLKLLKGTPNFYHKKPVSRRPRTDEDEGEIDPAILRVREAIKREEECKRKRKSPWR